MEKLDFEKTFRNKRVLIIYPHPDDEVFSVGGLIQRLVKQKVDFQVLCLTKGEASTLRFGLNEEDKLDARRESEYKSVMRYLGVNNFKIESFPDKKLREIPNEIKEYISQQISKYKPNILVTYEPCGVYGHPDHIFISDVITELAKNLKLTLIYTTINPKLKIPRSMKSMADFPDQIHAIYPTHVMALSLSEFLKKITAWFLHESQTKGSYSKVIGQILIALIFKKEYFHII